MNRGKKSLDGPLTNVMLTAIGREMEGGTIELVVGNRRAAVDLPPSEFGCVLALCEQAVSAPHPNLAFVVSGRIRKRIAEHLHVSKEDSFTIEKLIWSVRGKFSAALGVNQEWIRTHLLQHRKHRGYRLALAPDHITMQFLCAERRKGDARPNQQERVAMGQDSVSRF